MVLRLRIDSEIIRFGRAAHQLDSASPLGVHNRLRQNVVHSAMPLGRGLTQRARLGGSCSLKRNGNTFKTSDRIALCGMPGCLGYQNRMATRLTPGLTRQVVYSSSEALSGWRAGKVRWGRIDDRDRCRLVV